MPITLSVLSGNIFTSAHQTIVNTVNCVGVMGAGLALECRLRYPEMFEKYVQLCDEGMIVIGKLWIFKSSDPGRWILNFPTKKHWKYPSKEEYLHAGLKKFMGTYEEKGITSIAFPLLGAQNGGLSASQSLAIMESYLKNCSIPVEIYHYDASAPDDLFEIFRNNLISKSPRDVSAGTGLRIDYVNRIYNALSDNRICQLGQLANVRGIGDKTLEKVFKYAQVGNLS